MLRLDAMEEARSLHTAQERIKQEQVADLIGLDDIISQANNWPKNAAEATRS